MKIPWLVTKVSLRRRRRRRTYGTIRLSRCAAGKKGIFLPSAPEIGGRGMIQNSFGPRTCPIRTLTGSPSFLVINQVAKVDCRPEETAEGRDKASLIKKQVRKTSLNKSPW